MTSHILWSAGAWQKRAATVERHMKECQELRRRFAALTTPHIADACIRAQLPVRCAPAIVHPAVPASRLAGRVCPARHAGSVDIFLEARASH
jgi:hypothetical protein